MNRIIEFVKRLFIIIFLLIIEFFVVLIITFIISPNYPASDSWPVYLILILWLLTIIWGFIAKDLNLMKFLIKKNNKEKYKKVNEEILTAAVPEFRTIYSSQNTDTPNLVVSFNKDFARTVLLEKISKKPQIISSDIESYPTYLKDGLGLVNPYLEYSKMINDGLIIEAPIENKLVNLDKSELIELSKELDLSITGSKKDLINRISVVDDAEIKAVKYLGHSKYHELSDFGKKFLDDNNDLIKLSNMYSVDKVSYFKLRDRILIEQKTPNFEEIAYIVLQDKIKKEFEKDLHRTVMHTLKDIAELCWNMNRLDEGLFYYIYSITMNLSCLGNNGYVKKSDYIISSLRSMRKLSSFDSSSVDSTIDKVLQKANLPYQKYSNDVIKIMILEFYTSGTIDIEKYRKFEIRPKYVTEYGSSWKYNDFSENDFDTE